MSRAQLLAAVSAKVGKPVSGSTLDYCLAKGHVSQPTKFGHLNSYSDQQLSELLTFCRTRSRALASN